MPDTENPQIELWVEKLKQLREKNTGTIKGETRILAVHDDYIEYKIHNVSKKDNKSDDLEETIEIINIPINKIESVSEGEKKNDLANAKLFTEQK